VSIRAHTDPFQFLVEQGITVSSVNDEIRIFAKDKLSFGAADSGFELNGPDITFTTPGTYQQLGGTHAFLPGATAAATLPALPSGQASIEPQAAIVERSYHDDEGVRQARYTAQLGDGGQHEGVTDTAGVVELAELPPGAVQVRFEPDGRSWERLDGSGNPHAVSPRPERADVDSLIDRARGSQP
jgi:type VI secretion system secreted protein VgrG